MANLTHKLHSVITQKVLKFFYETLNMGRWQSGDYANLFSFRFMLNSLVAMATKRLNFKISDLNF
jgi:hypothetical protein